MRNYVYSGNFAIGYMNGDKVVLFTAPIAAALLTD
jgi:hypothetical protein